MEQQPGPVNWAPYNPAPLPGMVRLWALEAFAHGAEVVSYFRWRQAPFAQEQMHAGLLRPDDQPAPGMAEAAEAARTIAQMPEVGAGPSPVALIFDYESAWAFQTQPQGHGQDYLALVFEHYRALRRLGVNVDVIGPRANMGAYALVAAPGLMTVPGELQDRTGLTVFGPRTGAKTPDFAIPSNLPPDIAGLDCKVAYAESLRPDLPVPLEGGGAFSGWREALEGAADIVERTEDGRPAIMRSGPKVYVGGAADPAALHRLYAGWLTEAGVATCPMPEGVRQRTTDQHRFLFNYDNAAQEFEGRTLPPASVTIDPV
jgi:beta-galactosidase